MTSATTIGQWPRSDRSPDNIDMTAPLAEVPDDRQRPVVYQTGAEPGANGERRRSLRVLMWIMIVLGAAVVSVGVAVGGSAVWSVVGPKTPGNVPLWIEPPTVAVHKLDSADTTRLSAPPTAPTVPVLPPGSSLFQGAHHGGDDGSGSRESRSPHDG